VTGFLTEGDEEVQADPGFWLVEVVIEPDPGNYPHKIGCGDCPVGPVDAYPRARRGWCGTSHRLHYRVPDGASGFRFQGLGLGPWTFGRSTRAEAGDLRVASGSRNCAARAWRFKSRTRRCR